MEGKTSADESFVKIQEFYPEDVNSTQIFKLQNPGSLQMIKLVFNNSTDFFGRITIYSLEIIGQDS